MSIHVCHLQEWECNTEHMADAWTGKQNMTKGGLVLLMASQI